MKLFPLILLSVIIFCTNLMAVQPSFEISPAPSWRTKINLEIENKDYSSSGDATYLLVDWQENEILHESCYRYAIRLNNEEGVQNNSQLSFSFDPSYQSLSLNRILIHRSGQTMNRLIRSEVELIRNEKNADYFIYDGSWSAFIILKDVRVGDVIEYEYTIAGQNPVFKDRIYSYISLGFASQVERIYQQMLVPSGSNLVVKQVCGGQKPVATSQGKAQSLVWDLKNQSAIYADANIPSWYNAYPACEVSSFPDWGSVKEWGRNLFYFELGKYEIQELISSKKWLKDENGIVGAIRFVQDDIRYLGIETGIHSHQPHCPDEVLKNRFGDCKDKSYLLVAILRELGVEAWPAYVHSSNKGKVVDNAPSPFAFNHVIVKFRVDQRDYWVDPTINLQRGGLTLICAPNYQKALVLDDKQNGLEDIPVSTFDRVVIRENFWFADSAKDARYEVESVYYGNLANTKRSYHLGKPLSEIRENYLNYCSEYYSGMKWAGDSALKYSDFPETNTFKVVESYLVPNFWDHIASDSVELYATISPYNLYEFLSYSKDQARKMPLALYYPIDVEQTINLHFPGHKQLGFKIENQKVENESFSFTKADHVSEKDKIYTINYSYQAKSDFVPVEKLSAYFKDYDKLSDLCDDTIHWGVESESSRKINWVAVVAVLLFIILLYRIFVFVYRFDFGFEHSGEKASKYYGWLLLPIIGLYFTPFAVGYHLFNTGYFTESLWVNFLAQRSDLPVIMQLLFYFELLFNVLIILMSVLLIVLSIQKRITFPGLYIAFKIIVTVGVIADTTICVFLLDTDWSDSTDLFRTVLGAMIWIPYFLYSSQVKSTFTNTYRRLVN